MRNEWIRASEAAKILTENSGHAVSTAYVRLLSNQGKLRTKFKHKRLKLYLKQDIEEYQVKGKGANKAPASCQQGTDGHATTDENSEPVLSLSA